MKRGHPMRKLIVLLLLGTVLWSGYWVVGSNAVRQGAEDFFANAPAQGLVAGTNAANVAAAMSTTAAPTTGSAPGISTVEKSPVATPAST